MIKKPSMIKKIYNNPEIYYGLGAISCLKSLEYQSFLILVSQTISKTEDYSKIKTYLAGKLIQEEIVEYATQDKINELKLKYQSMKPNVIIAIGGGKIIDTAKVVKVLLDNPTYNFETLEKNRFCDVNQIKLIAIPTTPGTGSEANTIAVIKNSASKKIPYVNQSFLPDLAILDHKFLSALSERALYEFAADIFSHSYEGQVSVASTSILKNISKSSFGLLISGFEQLKINNKDPKGLADLLYAGYLAGIVQGNAFVGVCHALAHTIDQQIPISHGNSILILLKPVLEWMKKTTSKPDYDEFLKIYNQIGFDKYRNAEIIKKIDKNSWADAALKDASISTTPIRMNKDNLLELINWILTQ